MPQGGFQYGDILTTVRGPVKGFTGAYIGDDKLTEYMRCLVLDTAGQSLKTLQEECRRATEEEVAAYMLKVLSK